MLGTKAETLKFLEQKLQSARIKAQFCITSDDWEQAKSNPTELLQKIFSAPELKNESTLIVRSSALNEDSATESFAGHFESVGNCEYGNEEKLAAAIEQVNSSYGENADPKNQILIQGQITDLATIGVLFTCDIDSLAPYYVVNYQDVNASFDAITAGKDNSHSTYVRYKESPNSTKLGFAEKLFTAASELESICNNDKLDIEFAIDANNELYILQVRPIVVGDKKSDVGKAEFKESLRKVHKKITKLNRPYPYVCGKRCVFGVMPDWNPAEIIGSKPRMLALSMYQELITDSIWAYQRSNYGYRNLRSFPLLRAFLGQPFVDARLTFNSFVPNSLEDNLAEKLVDHYIDSLIASPHVHDKIEFSIVYSCYYLNLPEKLNDLKEKNFSANEIISIADSLRELTSNIIDPEKGLYLKDLEKIATLEKKQKTIIDSDLSSIDKIYWLLEDCKRYGTLPFAGLARAAFIATQFLLSMVELEIISEEDKNAFLASLNTVAKEFNQDHQRFVQNEINRDEFMDKYGHLRPGTYDILSLRYDEGYDNYFNDSEVNTNEESPSKFTLADEQKSLLAKKLSECGLNISVDALFDFMKTAIESREYAKFVFTKSLSEAFVILEQFADRFDVSRDELSHLNISLVRDLYSSVTNEDIPDILLNNIRKNKAEHRLTNSIRLPVLILDENDIYDFFLQDCEPNFVSLKRLCAEPILEKNMSSQEMAGKIVFIPSADPGYDWIFSKNIAGLVTMFGGANSHMAIRAAELSLPAVIGAGEQKFNLWANSKSIELDCASKTVRVLD